MAQFMEKPRTATHFRLGTRLAGYLDMRLANVRRKLFGLFG